MSEEKPGISPGFYRNISTLGVIVLAVFYVVNEIKAEFNESLQPVKDYIERVDKKVDVIDAQVKIVEPMVKLNDYRVNQHEQIMKEFLRPESIERKKYGK